jgi:hypothetical protein
MDTISGEGASVVISHAAPTSCIQVAIFEAMAAIQSARKSGLLNGCHGLATGMELFAILCLAVF